MSKIGANWIHDTPVHSDVEAKLRQLLIELGNDDKIVGVQVCAYKDGKVIIDTSAGVLGPDDPRPVQPDTLFPVFSVTKGITAGMMHWLVDKGKLGFDQNVASIWPEFGKNGKDLIKVHHVLNHTSGLHNGFALAEGEDPLVMADWDGCLNRIVQSVPETEPGKQQLYHYQSFGWLCGGMIEHASGKKFQEILEEAIVQPLEIDGELYIGIPPGVESRLAVLSTDTEDVSKISQSKSRPDLPSSFQPEIIAEIMTTVPSLFNLLQIRQAILPATNGHCSARALARYYAALVDGGLVPLSHSNLSKPPLGSHPHIPEEENQVVTNENNTNFHEDKVEGSNDLKRNDRLDSSETGDDGKESKSIRAMFSNPKIHEAFLGLGEYGNWAMADGAFGLGFRRMRLRDGSFVGFGHTGMGGSTGFCYTKERLAIAVTVNELSLGDVTRKITELICSELNIPLHEHYTAMTEEDKPDTESITKTILIN